MPVHVTFHEPDNIAVNNGMPVVVLGRRRSNSISLTVSASKANTGAAPCDGWARIVTTEVCRVEIGRVNDTVHNSQSPIMLANTEWVRAVREGDIVSVVASA